MPPFTKKAIVESFLHLAVHKSPDKITVRDIVDDCGINRNTFYYYFQDIYAVLEDICRSGLDRVPTDASLSDTVTAAFRVLADFALRHARAMRNIGITVGRDGADRYFAAGLDAAFFACLTREHPDADKAFLKKTAVCVRHAFLGVFIDWLRTEKKPEIEDVCADLARLCAVFAAADL